MISAYFPPPPTRPALRAHRDNAAPRTAAATDAACASSFSESERHPGGWEFRYQLVPSLEKFTGSAQIHCQGQSHGELAIFEPQANALASMDLLREQCLAWIEARAAGTADR